MDLNLILSRVFTYIIYFLIGTLLIYFIVRKKEKEEEGVESNRIKYASIIMVILTLFIFVELSLTSLLMDYIIAQFGFNMIYFIVSLIFFLGVSIILFSLVAYYLLTYFYDTEGDRIVLIIILLILIRIGLLNILQSLLNALFISLF